MNSILGWTFLYLVLSILIGGIVGLLVAVFSEWSSEKLAYRPNIRKVL